MVLCRVVLKYGLLVGGRIAGIHHLKCSEVTKKYLRHVMRIMSNALLHELVEHHRCVWRFIS
jgi:hypothetical protein